MRKKYLSLEQICQHVLSEVIKARTDFILRQNEIVTSVNKSVPGIMLDLASLDVSKIEFGFFIQPQKQNFLKRVIDFFKTTNKKSMMYHLCSKDLAGSIQVKIELCLQNGQISASKIDTSPSHSSIPFDIQVHDFIQR
ncbi:MAG: hypothetical protein WCM76_15050 [Bacteroidota bacterium]